MGLFGRKKKASKKDECMLLTHMYYIRIYDNSNVPCEPPSCCAEGMGGVIMLLCR